MTPRPRPRWVLFAVSMTAGFGLAGIALVSTVATAGEADPPTPADVTQEAPEVASQPIVAAAVTTAATVAPTATVPTAPEIPSLYVPTDNESQPEAKFLGTTVAHQLTNYEAGSSLAEIAAAVTGDPDRRAGLIEAAAALHHGDRWSRGVVEYAQLGGLTSDKTSIMVVVRQELGPDVEPQRETRTLDIRLHKVDGKWAFDHLADAGGEPVPRPADLSPEAAAVVDDPRIVLADSARWDIYRGHTSTTLLRLMSALADQTPYAAVVLSNGHPYHVFETDRVSRHSIGQAIDIYLLGSDRVIDTRDPGSDTSQLVQWIYDRPEVKEVGSPWALDGPGGRSFTNEVHHDHIHIGVHDLD